MSAQLAFDFTPPLSDERWTYYFGLPDRSGAAQYTHLIRWHGDPPETVARGGASRADPRGEWVERMGDAEWWAARIETLMRDGRARTYNAICVDLEGVTADAMFDCPADAGLWMLVERYVLGWCCEEGAVFFLHRACIDCSEVA